MNRLRQLTLLFLFPCLLVAQGVDIRGIVSDSSTGERIPFANILLLNTSKGASSNLQGFYLITSVPPGQYQISASSVGYESRVKEITVRSGASMTVNFELPSKPVEMSGMDVTGKGKKELTEIHTSVHILEQRDIRSVPMAAQDDVFRSIGILPGIVSTSDVTSQFYVRGGAGDQNLILLDGMKIFNPYHAFGIFSIFDSDLIKTTEVYTGAFPAEYGGRLSSVVSMTTRDGDSKKISGRGNINFLSTKLELNGPSMGGTNWLVSGRKSLFSQTLGKFLNKDIPLSFYDALLKFTMVDGEGQGKYSVEWFTSGDVMRSSNPNEPDYSWKTSAFGLVASSLIQDRLYVNVVGYGNSFTGSRDAKSSPDISSSTASVREAGVRVNGTLYTDNHDLFLFGFEFNFPMLEDWLVNNAGVHLHYYSDLAEASVWTQYQFTAGLLKADLGVNLDLGSLMSRDAGFEVVQPRLNLSYPLWQTWVGKVSYGRFTQSLITLNNEDDIISIFDTWVQLAGQLKPELADHYVVGLEGNPLRNFSASFQGYYKDYRSLVLYNRDKIDSQDPDYINGTGAAYGFETLLRYGTNAIDLYGAYSLAWTSVTTRGFTYNPRYDRRHTLNLLVTYRPIEGLEVGARWQFGSGLPYTQTIGYYDRLALTNIFRGPWVSETPGPYIRLGDKNAARLPTYHRLDVNATYRFTARPFSGSIGVSIINAYNHKNLFYFDRKTGQQVDMLPVFPTATLSLEF
ncbi:MAG: TonB-dependent receptor [Ignavibacteriales bacterium]|nr:TonB-dependent receptor [Ignavibacteriales bacterium]